MRGVGLLLVVAFIALLGVLTAVEIARNGLSPLGVISILVLAMFAIGLIGAFRSPPPD